MVAYDRTFFGDLHAGSAASARTIASMLRDLIRFDSVADAGCGTGAWLAAFAETGTTDFLGLDGPWVNQADLAIPADRFRVADFSKPVKVERRFDLAVSVEVAEHLPESAAGPFVDTLASLAPVVVFSAAIPGQGGTSHLNEQWPDVWASKFAARGYACIDCLRLRLWNEPSVQWWYAQNIMIYADRAGLASQPALAEAAARQTGAAPFRLVHPACLDAARRAPLEFCRVLREGPGALRRSLARTLDSRRTVDGAGG